MNEVTPLTLGTHVAGDTLDVVIPRNTPYPFRVVSQFANSATNQRRIVNLIYEGEYTDPGCCYKNVFVNEFEMIITPMPKGQCLITEIWEMDKDGILSVTATEEISGKTASTPIIPKNNRLDDKAIERMIEEAKKFKLEDDKAQHIKILLSDVEMTCLKMKNEFPTLKAALSAEEQNNYTIAY